MTYRPITPDDDQISWLNSFPKRFAMWLGATMLIVLLTIVYPSTNGVQWDFVLISSGFFSFVLFVKNKPIAIAKPTQFEAAFAQLTPEAAAIVTRKLDEQSHRPTTVFKLNHLAKRAVASAQARPRREAALAGEATGFASADRERRFTPTAELRLRAAPRHDR